MSKSNRGCTGDIDGNCNCTERKMYGAVYSHVKKPEYTGDYDKALLNAHYVMTSTYRPDKHTESMTLDVYTPVGPDPMCFGRYLVKLNSCSGDCDFLVIHSTSQLFDVLNKYLPAVKLAGELSTTDGD